MPAHDRFLGAATGAASHRCVRTLLALLLALATGCGGEPAPDEDAGTVRDAGPSDAGPRDGGLVPVDDAGMPDGGVVRIPCATVDDCPEQPCEVASACSTEGFCEYEPFVCSSGGSACPVLVCQSHAGTAGELVNTCVEVSGAACGEGGSCSGTQCVVPTTGLRLIEGGIRAGSVNGALTGTAGRQFTLEGHLGFITPRGAPRSSGRARLTGGIRP